MRWFDVFGWRRPSTDPTAVTFAHLRFLFETLQVDTVLDVGGHRGEYGDSLRCLAHFQGCLTSFEPDPANYARLQAHAARDPNWRVLSLALGASDAELNLNLAVDSRFSSLREPDPRRESLRRETAKVGTVPVQVRRLDAIWPELRQQSNWLCPFLHIDAQGYSLEILLGAESILPEIAALQVETGVQPLYAGAANYRDVIDHLEQRGFVLSALFPVRLGMLKLLELDCVMVNSRYLTRIE